jgi:hypothetical protein
MTLSATKIGSTFLQPGAAGPIEISLAIELQLLFVSEDALWSENNQEHKCKTNQDEANLTNLRW